MRSLGLEDGKRKAQGDVVSCMARGCVREMKEATGRCMDLVSTHMALRKQEGPLWAQRPLWVWEETQCSFL